MSLTICQTLSAHAKHVLHIWHLSRRLWEEGNENNLSLICNGVLRRKLRLTWATTLVEASLQKLIGFLSGCCCFQSMAQLMLSLPGDQRMEYATYHSDNPRGETGGQKLYYFIQSEPGKSFVEKVLKSGIIIASCKFKSQPSYLKLSVKIKILSFKPSLSLIGVDNFFQRQHYIYLICKLKKVKSLLTSRVR